MNGAIKPPFEYSTLSDPTEMQRLGTLLAQCFNSPPDHEETYLKRIGANNFRIIRQHGQLVGGLATIPMGQWFGAQCVPMVGIAGVGIAPEYRGSGAAIALMQSVVQELHSNGVPISALYPAAQRLYRKAGYEQGGSLCSWEIPTADIQMKEQPLSFHAVDAAEYAQFQPLYQQKAKGHNGNLDRHPALWQGIINPDETEPVYAYLIGNTNQPQGYLIFSQHRTRDGSIVRVRDWTALTVVAAKSLWSFLATHRSQVETIRWRGEAIEPLTLLLPEQTAQLRSVERWMVRIINVDKALVKRGYPSGIQAELHLDIHDDLLPENNGKLILTVSNGQGEVNRGGTGELKLTVQALTPLYTGLFTPYQLAAIGYLDGSELALSTATQLFAGSSPWMPDFF
jgi:predicted acetyltransferase